MAPKVTCPTANQYCIVKLELLYAKNILVKKKEKKALKLNPTTQPHTKLYTNNDRRYKQHPQYLFFHFGKKVKQCIKFCHQRF